MNRRLDTAKVSIREFLEYLLRREQTHDLALELAYVYDIRRPRPARVTGGH